jgi:hypothetical protein
MLQRVDFVRTDVSEEHIASIIRTTTIGELGTTLAVTSNRITLRRNTLLIVTPRKAIISSLPWQCSVTSFISGYYKTCFPSSLVTTKHVTIFYCLKFETTPSPQALRPRSHIISPRKRKAQLYDHFYGVKIQRFRVRFPAPPDFLRRSGSWTGPTSSHAD